MWALLLMLLFGLVTADSTDLLQYRFTEELPAGYVLGNLLVDLPLSSRLEPRQLSELTFSVLPPGDTHGTLVVIETRTGVLRTARRLDREELCPGNNVCLFDVDIATGPAHLFSIITVQLQIDDVNDNPATFLDQMIERSISEDAPIGSLIPLPPAYDNDSGQNGIISYTTLISTSWYVCSL